MNETDLQLLQRYVSHGAEDAFAEIIRRHVELVYSVAVRHVRSPQLAQEVAQSTFSDLARSASRLPSNVVLAAWLHQVARRTAVDVVRRETRRQLREQVATEMNALNATESSWKEIEPLLDDAVTALGETDRAAVLLRYFENKSLHEVGLALGTSEAAAQKRVSRALERLREFFTKRGIRVGTTSLAAVMSTSAVQSAPTGLASTISAAALVPMAGAPAAGTAALLRPLLQLIRAKPAAILIIAALVSLTAISVLRSPEASGAREPADRIGQGTGRSGLAASPVVEPGDPERRPDPRALLRGVERAREKLRSGLVRMEAFLVEHNSGGTTTNQYRLELAFDADRLRSEHFGREFSYAYSPLEGEQADICRRADAMSREDAVAAGLLKPFESHHSLAYDGTVLLDYWENDGKPVSTRIDDPDTGAAQFLFDPRCLGLDLWLSARSSVAGCLGYNRGALIELVGEESVEGLPAWRVRLQSETSGAADFWIDKEHTHRLLMCARGQEVAVSKYGGPGDPIPTEVVITRSSRVTPTLRFVVTDATFNVPVEPGRFTLAGLGMPVGTQVYDHRNQAGLGYWTGSGLSPDLPHQDDKPVVSAHTQEERLALLDYDPGSPEALAAAKWILFNTPDGPEVEKAAEAVLRAHTGDSELADLCRRLEQLRHRCSKPLLEAIARENPSVDVKGIACLALGRIFKDEANYGLNREATREAEKQFERASSEFAQVKERGYTLKELAEPELRELRQLIIGKTAPDIEGVDLGGQPLRLSDYRGKTVVVVFWWRSSVDELIKLQELADRKAGKPLAVVGVYGDSDLTKGQRLVEEHGIAWPSFWDDRDGPVTRRWNVKAWPNIWVLDGQGVIRHRDLRGAELEKAVEKLLQSAIQLGE